MEYVVGISVALGITTLLGSVIGFDRDRAFYPFMTMVTASYYQLFAIIAGSSHALAFETGMFLAFAALCILGFKTSLWLVVIALAGHGAFDLLHADLFDNPGVPRWWPMFCLSYDLVAALYLAWLLLRSPQARGGAQRRSDPSTLSHRGHPIRPFVQTELDAAVRAESDVDPTSAFHNLERAHVLSQISTREHVRVHWRMLIWGIHRRDAKEIAGQLLRIIGAATKTGIGLVPSGNTGGANVSPFKPMPIPDDIAVILANAAKD